MIGTGERVPRVGVCVLAAGLTLAAVALLGGCEQKKVLSAEGLAALRSERFSGSYQPTPLFNPAPPGAASPRPADQAAAVELPPMEAFNWRPAWPATGATSLGEVTFFREWYSDWQSSSTSGHGTINNWYNRNFESYRYGMMVR
jgi:hypothetical protein